MVLDMVRSPFNDERGNILLPTMVERAGAISTIFENSRAHARQFFDDNDTVDPFSA